MLNPKPNPYPNPNPESNPTKVGHWVEVLYEYAPGTCFDGGVGTVMSYGVLCVGQDY
jgi:hypothetical protein